MASVAQRIGSRAIDLAAFVVLVAAVGGVEALLRAATGIDSNQAGDWITPLVGLVYLLLVISYDPLTSRLLGGTTPGKKTMGRRVVRWSDGAHARSVVLLGRNVLLVLEWMFLVPGIVDLALSAKRPDGRTWVDQAMGTAVVNERAVPPSRQSIQPMWRPEPWGGLVAAAAAARSRLDQTVGSVPAGPLRERLQAVESRAAECEAECVRIADRGMQLARAVAGTDLGALRARFEQAGTSGGAGSALAEAYAKELASAERLTALVMTTERKLYQLVAELNSSVNTAIEIALSPPSEETFRSLIDQLDTLKASIEIVQQGAG